jgi:hypothetical protein
MLAVQVESPEQMAPRATWKRQPTQGVKSSSTHSATLPAMSKMPSGVLSSELLPTGASS